jgi:hypothetical protein
MNLAELFTIDRGHSRIEATWAVTSWQIGTGGHLDGAESGGSITPLDRLRRKTDTLPCEHPAGYWTQTHPPRLMAANWSKLSDGDGSAQTAVCDSQRRDWQPSHMGRWEEKATGSARTLFLSFKISFYPPTQAAEKRAEWRNVRRNRNPREEEKTQHQRRSRPPNVDANATVSASGVQGSERDGQILVGSVPGFSWRKSRSEMRHTFRSRRRQAGGERNFSNVSTEVDAYLLRFVAGFVHLVKVGMIGIGFAEQVLKVALVTGQTLNLHNKKKKRERG